jgi:hypothetical protein
VKSDRFKRHHLPSPLAGEARQAERQRPLERLPANGSNPEMEEAAPIVRPMRCRDSHVAALKTDVCIVAWIKRPSRLGRDASSRY